MQLEVAREPEVPELSNIDVENITKIVFRVPNPQRSDLIFIFGYGPGHTEANWRDVAKLFKDGFSNQLLVNGLLDPHHPEPNPPISHVIRDYLVRFGVPKEKIFVQDKSRNTMEDVIFGQNLLKASKIYPKSVLFVSKAHHSGRCYLTLRKYFPEVKLSAFTFNAVYNNVKVSKAGWSKHPVARARVYGEYLRIIKYSERGDIERPEV